MDFSPSKIKEIAGRAKISLTDQEINQFSTQLSALNDLIEKLKTVDTSSCDPVHNPSKGFLTVRPDNVSDGGCAELIVKNSPKDYMNFFVVPKVIE